MTGQSRLHHLLDRARRGVLLPAEGEQLAGLVAELETVSDRWGRMATAMSEGANTRAALLEEARDALENAGAPGAHGDDWPRLVPAIEKLAAENVKLRDRLAHCRHKPRVAELEAEVARLTAGQCTHDTAPDLRTRCVAALTAAACDGDCGLTEQACQAAHPITSAIAGGVTHIDGPVDGIVDTVLAAAAHTEQPTP